MFYTFKLKSVISIGIIIFVCIAMLLSILPPSTAVEADAKTGYIKWVSFDVSQTALNDTLSADISSHETDKPLDWIELLAVLGTKYGGNFKSYKKAHLNDIITKIKNGATPEEIGSKYGNYTYFYKAYSAVLDGFCGDYSVKLENGYESKYGLKAFSPVASGYYFSHYDDFGSSRSFGYRRKHLGNDLMGNIGTPIVAVESGYVEAIGWNIYGGWRIGIRSFDKKRYYYYAHLRKNKPYALNLKEGSVVKAGDVIGYLGMTGYSTKENTNNINVPHLHFGMQLIFDESQKEGINEIWIDVYAIVNFLDKNKSKITKAGDEKVAANEYIFPEYTEYMEGKFEK